MRHLTYSVPRCISGTGVRSQIPHNGSLNFPLSELNVLQYLIRCGLGSGSVAAEYLALPGYGLGEGVKRENLDIVVTSAAVYNTLYSFGLLVHLRATGILGIGIGYRSVFIRHYYNESYRYDFVMGRDNRSPFKFR